MTEVPQEALEQVIKEQINPSPIPESAMESLKGCINDTTHPAMKENIMEKTLRDLFRKTVKGTDAQLIFIMNSNPKKDFLLKLAQRAVNEFYGDKVFQQSVLESKHSITLHDMIVKYCCDVIEETFDEIVDGIPIETICGELSS